MLNQNQTSDEDASLEDQRFNELVERIAREIPIEMEGIIGEWCQENLKTRTYYRDYLSLFSAEFLDQIERYVSALRASWFAYQVDEEDLFDAAIRSGIVECIKLFTNLRLNLIVQE
jgi:hypothetical protein